MKLTRVVYYFLFIQGKTIKEEDKLRREKMRH